MTAERVNPPQLSPPTGFSHAVVATGTRVVFLVEPDRPRHRRRGHRRHPPRPVRAGPHQPPHRPARRRGTPADLARVTVYATDVAAYRTHAAELGRTWRELAYRDYPAMAVVEVVRLWDERALVELDGFAVLP